MKLTNVRSLSAAFGGFAIAAALFISPASAMAIASPLTINSVKVNGASSVSVAPSASVVASTSATISGEKWGSTYVGIGSNPSSAICQTNSVNHVHDGSFSEHFSVNAPSVPGTYNVYVQLYSKDCTDHNGTFSATTTLVGAVTVSAPSDTTPPVITINPYNTALTNQDVVVTASTNEGSLNATSHSFTANGSFDFVAVDSSGNTSTSTVTITNIDKTAPVIALLGDSSPSLNVGDSYIDAGATASDNVDGNITANVSTTGSVNTSVPGVYVIHYNVSDIAGNAADEAIRSVSVSDVSAPVFSGVPSDITAEAASASGAVVSFTDPTATDDVDGSVAVSCTPASGSTFGFGTTAVDCSASDNSAHTAHASFNVTVQDTTAPVIALNGAASVNITIGDAYADAGATASDNIDGDISGSIVSSGSVDISTEGDYVLSYNVSDSHGNAATEVTRTVHVLADPVVTLDSIAVTTPADKLTYTVGDSLDLAGLVVTGTYSDESTSPVSVSADNVTGFDSSASATGQVLTITVDGKTTTYSVDIVAPASVNHAPALNEIPDTTITLGQTASFTASATDSDEDSISFSLGEDAPAGATIDSETGAFSWTPSETGTTTFTVIATDTHGATSTQQATVIVNAVAPVESQNHAPTANDQLLSTGENTPVGVTFTGSDADEDALTYSVVDGPSHGSVTEVVNGSLIYSPSADFTGTDSFTFKANDGKADSATSTITITVNAPAQTTNTNTSGGGGGGGGSTGSSGGSTRTFSILDFNTLLVNWGQTGINNPGDFNSDGIVDILDFNVLLINWAH